MGLTAINSMEIEEPRGAVAPGLFLGTKDQTVGQYREQLQHLYNEHYPNGPAFVEVPKLKEDGTLEQSNNQLVEVGKLVFSVPNFYYKNSKTIADMVEDLGNIDSLIPLHNTSQRGFLNYLFILANWVEKDHIPLTHKIENLVLEESKRPDLTLLSDASVKWINEFLALVGAGDKYAIPEILNCANYLSSLPVLHFVSRYVAQTMINGKTTEQIRQAFGIVLGKEEQEQMNVVEAHMPWKLGKKAPAHGATAGTVAKARV